MVCITFLLDDAGLEHFRAKLIVMFMVFKKLSMMVHIRGGKYVDVSKSLPKLLNIILHFLNLMQILGNCPGITYYNMSDS